MTTARPDVQVETVFRLIRPSTSVKSIEVSLRYLITDPCAVHMLFGKGPTVKDAKLWVISRSVLATGLDSPSGMGHVEIRPLASPTGMSIGITLSGEGKTALLEAPRSVLVRFLRMTYQVVPCGKEADFLDIDEVIRRIFADQ